MPSHATHHSPAQAHDVDHSTPDNHYVRLLVMTVLSFAAMYALMYAMVDSFSSVFNSVNQAYMAGLMAAAMVIIELGVMGMMYRNRALNVVIIGASIAGLIGCWMAIRTQTGVADLQFLRSMIPHHSGAILMCGKASIRDRELQELCKSIIASQEAEIRQMKAKLQELSQ